MSHVVGIDLGTTNSVVAVYDSGQPSVIVNSEGAKTTPSVVLYQDDGEPVVGELAKRQLLTAPGRVIRSVKRLIGRRYEEVKDQPLSCPFEIKPSPEGETLIVVGELELTPAEVSAEVLKKMARTASDFLGQEVEQAVITVPAYFNDSQRVATKEAGELAGLQVIRIVNEPTAAALAYGLGRGAVERVAVFDFGGGTFDISILDIDEDVFEVKSTNGDTFLGGDNIDQLLADDLIAAITAETGVDVRAIAPEESLVALQRVREAAEKVKCELSTLASTVVSLPFIAYDASGPKHFNRAITRGQFEELIAPLLARLGPPCRQALRDAKLRPEDISTVLLVGGSTRIPAVQRIAREIFGREPSRAVSPDEAVALGASVQAGVLTGALQEVLLLDVTPLSLGIELQGGIFSPLIPRNSTIPTTVSKTFTTVRDNQSTVLVHVLQGERRAARENRTLARFRLTGIDPAPREIPQVAVSFNIDANGILNVSAQDLSSGVRKEVTVESYVTAATDEETQRALEDAESRAGEDREFLMLARARTRAEGAAENVRAYLQAHRDSLTEEDTRVIMERLMAADVALCGTDISAIDTAERALRELPQRFEDLVFLDRLV